MTDTSSNMMETDVHARLAGRVSGLRSAAGLSLEALAARSGVSRSMISLIERAEASPTAAVLDKLAAGLGVSLASLFDEAAAPAEPLARCADQPIWRDPASGYQRRNVSPPGQPLSIVAVDFPAGARVALDSPMRHPPLHQQVWVLDGTIELTRGDRRDRLEAGDCLAMDMGGPTVFHNPTRSPARYAVVIATDTPRGARR